MVGGESRFRPAFLGRRDQCHEKLITIRPAIQYLSARYTVLDAKFQQLSFGKAERSPHLHVSVRYLEDFALGFFPSLALHVDCSRALWHMSFAAAGPSRRKQPNSIHS